MSGHAVTDEADARQVCPVWSISPSRGWLPVDLVELWRYRELLYFLTWRDVKVRYKQTILGGAWAMLQPLFMMAVCSLFLGGLAAVPSDRAAYRGRRQ